MKKLLSLMLAAALALSLAGCGGDSGAENTETPSTSPSESIVPTENTETEQPSDSVPPEETPSEDVEPSPAPEAEFVTATIGETITLEGADVELTTGTFQSDPELLGGYITMSDHSDSNNYFWLSGTMTNVGTETVSHWFDSIVKIIFDDTYTYEGDLDMKDDIGPFGETEIMFWADVPPAMLERYETVKVQFAYNDGFADFDWASADEYDMAGFDHQYEFVLGEGGSADLSGADGAVAGNENATIAIGDTVTTNDYEFTLTNVELTYELLPPDTSGSYVSYPAESGKVYIHVAADVKNIMQRDIRIDELFDASALYDGKYTYNGFTIINDGDNRFDYVGSYSAATPLETCKAHSLIECPVEVDTSGSPIVVMLDLGGTTYEYTLR